MRAAGAILAAGPRLATRAPLPGPRARRRLLGLVLAAAVLCSGYLLWFRDSSLVGVDTVSVTGLSSDDAGRIRRLLTSEARTMTTLHVSVDELEEAVAGFPIVERVAVSPDFPSTLRIRVIEHHPAAVVVAGGSRRPVAGDGTVLEGLPAPGPLPVVRLRGAPPAERLDEEAALRSVRVLGAAPRELSGRLEAASVTRERGVVAQLREGPELIFGEATRLRAKWAAAARVLADPSSGGASYVDLRLPGRPAAGGLPAETLAPVAPAGEESQSPLNPQP